MNSNDNLNSGKIQDEKLLKVFSHLFFISLLIAAVFGISTVINIMVQRAYQPEPLTINENHPEPVKKVEIPSFAASQTPPVLSHSAVDSLSDSEEVQSTVMKPEKAKSTGRKITRISGKDLGFHVTGIIINKEGNRAVITGKNGRSYMIQTKEKIGKWFVDSIEKEQVILKTDGYIAVLEPSAGCRSLKMPVKDTFEGIVGIDDNDPGFRLTGIMKNESEINAILTGLDGRSYTVKPGQVVGIWTVSFITDKMVFLKNNKTLTIAVLELNPPSQEIDEMKHQKHYQDVLVL